MAKDYLGWPINVGDDVIFVQSGYRNFQKGIITKITDKMLQITPDRGGNFKQAHSQVIKFDRADAKT